MINNTDIEQYRRIKAPAGLKESVLTSTNKTPARRLYPKFKTVYRAVGSIAACIVLVLIGTVMFQGRNSNINIYVDETATVNASSRLSSYVTVVVSSDSDLNIKTQTDGFFYYSEDELVSLTNLKQAGKKMEVIWQISDTPSKFSINGQEYEISYSVDDQTTDVKKIK